MTSCLQKVGIWMHYRDPTGINLKESPRHSFFFPFHFSETVSCLCFWISIHICVTLQHVPVVNDFLQDLREAVETVRLPMRRSLLTWLLVSSLQLIDLSVITMFLVRWKQTQDRSQVAWLRYMEQLGRCRTEAWWMSFLLVSWTANTKSFFSKVWSKLMISHFQVARGKNTVHSQPDCLVCRYLNFITIFINKQLISLHYTFRKNNTNKDWSIRFVVRKKVLI